ncbi:hypothetical protein ACROYT_G039656 [Oculina patagonica]
MSNSGMNCASAFVFDANKQCREIISLIATERADSLPAAHEKWLLCNKEVATRLQGKFPRCGLSAISMAAELLRTQRSENKTALSIKREQYEEELENLLTMARSKGFSLQGEMYSAENLAQLAKEFFGLECQVISDGFADHPFVISELLKGSAVLVPYDADKNHKPCLEKGHKAHWALLTGFLCELDGNIIDWTMFEQDMDVPMLFHASPSPSFMLPHNCKPQHIYFCAKHGKSNHTAVWSLDSLKSSNENLFELDPSKEKQVESYIVPEEGLRVGLCGKIVVISDQR